MPDSPDVPRRYDSEEVKRIFERASQLRRTPATDPSSDGLTLGEVEEIAAEAGFDPSLIRTAATELEEAPESTWIAKFLGASPKTTVEQALPFEATDDALPLLAQLIRVKTGHAGEAFQVGGSWTWRSAHQVNLPLPPLEVVVSTRPGETRIRMKSVHNQAVALAVLFGIFGLSISFLFGLFFTLERGLPLGMTLATALAGGTYWALRTVLSGTMRKQERELKALMKRVVETLTHARGAGGKSPAKRGEP